jgi:hypothetical protein
MNSMNKKSMLDRDNIELYIVSEDEEQVLADFIMELNETDGWIDLESNPDDLPKLQPWQEEILNKEMNTDE